MSSYPWLGLGGLAASAAAASAMADAVQAAGRAGSSRRQKRRRKKGAPSYTKRGPGRHHRAGSNSRGEGLRSKANAIIRLQQRHADDPKVLPDKYLHAAARRRRALSRTMAAAGGA